MLYPQMWATPLLIGDERHRFRHARVVSGQSKMDMVRSVRRGTRCRKTFKSRRSLVAANNEFDNQTGRTPSLRISQSQGTALTPLSMCYTGFEVVNVSMGLLLFFITRSRQRGGVCARWGFSFAYLLSGCPVADTDTQEIFFPGIFARCTQSAAVSWNASG